jgi:hypothetical protein
MSTVKIFTSQDVQIESPAAPIPVNAKLISQRRLNNLDNDKPACIAMQTGAGDFFIQARVTVNGTVPAGAVVPSLAVSYSHKPDDFGTTTHSIIAKPVSKGGESVSEERTYSTTVPHNGQGCLIVGASGGKYGGKWNYDFDLSIHMLQASPYFRVPQTASPSE